MSTDRDTTRIVRSWLEEGVTALPDRVLDTVLDQLPATPQRRSSWLARRFPLMSNNLIRIGIAAAAAVLVAIVGINLVPRDTVGPPNGSPAPTPTAGVATALFTVVRAFPQAVTGILAPAKGSGPEGIGMAVGPDGLLYVTDLKPSVSVIDPATGATVRSWGAKGSGDGQFGNIILSIAVAPSGLVYVADPGNKRIQVFSADGTYLRQMARFFGTQGNEPLRFLAVGADGSVYAPDWSTTSLVKFDADGGIVWRRGGPGETDLRDGAYDVAVMKDGKILATFDAGGSALLLDPSDGSVVGAWAGGALIGDSAEPSIDAAGNIFVFQYGAPASVSAFDASGSPLGTIASDVFDLYPAPVFTPNGHAYSFNQAQGLVDLEVHLSRT